MNGHKYRLSPVVYTRIPRLCMSMGNRLVSTVQQRRKDWRSWQGRSLTIISLDSVWLMRLAALTA